MLTRRWQLTLLTKFQQQVWLSISQELQFVVEVPEQNGMQNYRLVLTKKQNGLADDLADE